MSSLVHFILLDVCEANEERDVGKGKEDSSQYAALGEPARGE